MRSEPRSRSSRWANLTRYALISADPIYRPDLLMVLAKREGLRILPREADDKIVPLSETFNYTRSNIADVEAIVRAELGSDTILASEVNGRSGLWVSISIDRGQLLAQNEQLPH